MLGVLAAPFEFTGAGFARKAFVAPSFFLVFYHQDLHGNYHYNHNYLVVYRQPNPIC
jgi:hypothetical protein